MKTLLSLGPESEPQHFEKLVNEFVSKFPKLLTQEGAYGKCKFVSYELALFLRKRRIPARIIHVQGIRPNVYPNPHRRYLNKPRKAWSHYVIKIGKYSVDLTARQFDTSLPQPYIQTMHQLRQQWELVEKDHFLNRWAREVLKHKDIA